MDVVGDQRLAPFQIIRWPHGPEHPTIPLRLGRKYTDDGNARILDMFPGCGACRSGQRRPPSRIMRPLVGWLSKLEAG